MDLGTPELAKDVLLWISFALGFVPLPWGPWVDKHRGQAHDERSNSFGGGVSRPTSYK